MLLINIWNRKENKQYQCIIL